PTEKILHHSTTELYNKKRIKFRGTQRRLPQTVIVGVRKCGTRALLEMLALHSYVVKKSEEMHFFDDDDIYENGLEWYRKKMPYSFDNQVTIEKTPSYFISREAPARIKEMNESVRLLVIVREPTTRVISDYAQILDSKKLRGKPYIPFEKRVLNEVGEINENYIAIKISQYFVHMVRWLRVFSLEQILVVDGEQLVRDPFPELKKVEKFLKLPSRFTPWNFYFNETKGFYCFRNENRQKCLPPSKGRKHPEIDPQLVSKLRRYFAPFNDHFYELIGQNFSWLTS
ncbi:Heparan sulfate glucosamine 3-O-sulfotransferase 5, partial [Armadillidium nasatum]